MIHRPNGGLSWIEIHKKAYIFRQDVAKEFALTYRVFTDFGTSVSDLPDSEALAKLMPRHAPQTKLCTYKEARELAANSTLPNNAKDAWAKLCVTRDDIAEVRRKGAEAENMPPDSDSDNEEPTEPPQAGEMRCDAT